MILAYNYYRRLGPHLLIVELFRPFSIYQENVPVEMNRFSINLNSSISVISASFKLLLPKYSIPADLLILIS